MNTTHLIVTTAASAALLIPAFAWGLRGPLRRFHAQELEWWRTASEKASPTPVPYEQYAALYYAGVVTVAFVCIVLAPRWWMVVPAVGACWVARHLVANVMWQRRRARIEAQLPEAIRSFAAAVNAGCTLPEAIARAATNSPQPIRTELRLMSNRYKAGAPLSDTIEAARRRLDLADFNLFASALLVGREMGGDIGNVLNRIAKAIESIHVMRGKVKSATSAGRLNLKCLYVAPFVFVAMTYFVDPDAVRLLINTPLGWLLLGVSAAIIFGAIAWARRIIGVDI